ncbi:uncharacterized protein LOC109714494 [Ananas comosus]|uniref:Uncharacterized protein LOC109714494 n=1 Tax=Ananas comosus TaxID=4615 RepID=A0A6P5FGN2_ANACO|nr:uncharacterized protein LOC109714494 [Ananas comosus]
MEKKVLAVSGIVGFLGLLSAILGFIANTKRIKASQVQLTTSGDCIYPESSAAALAVVAAVTLLFAQLIASAATGCGCCCCCKGSTRQWKWNCRRVSGLIAAIVSWFTFILAFSIFISAAVWNSRHRQSGQKSCYVLRSRDLPEAAILSLITAILGVSSYVSLRD